MELSYTIPLPWVIGLSITVIGSIIRFWYKVKSHDERIIALVTRLDELEDATDEKHNKLYNEIKNLDAKFSAQNNLLGKIETKLDLLIANKIKL